MKNTGIRLITGCPCLSFPVFCLNSCVRYLSASGPIIPIVFFLYMNISSSAKSVLSLYLYERTSFYMFFPFFSLIGDVKYDC